MPSEERHSADAADKSTADHPSPDPPGQIGGGSVVSDHTLISLLQASVDRLKTTVDSQQGAAELRDREERRTAIMVKLAMEQLERAKEVQSKMQKDIDALTRELAASGEERTQLRSTVAESEAALLALRLQKERLANDIAAQLTIERSEKAALSETIAQLRKELSDAKDAAVTAAKKGELQYRELYQNNVTTTAILSSKNEELEFLTEQRQKEARQIAEREYDLNRTIASLKKSVSRLESDLDAQRKSSFETITLLQSESEPLKLRVAQLEQMMQATDRSATERVEKLKDELRRLQERAETDYSAATVKEKALQQECAILTANLRAAQKEINELAGRDAETRRMDVDERIKLIAERDTLKMRVTHLERQLQDAVANARAEAIQLKTDAESARHETLLANQRFAMEMALMRDENTKLKDELSSGAQQLSAAVTSAAAERDALKATIETNEKEIKRLHIEISGYKETVEKLDRHVRENYAARILEDEVESLKQQNVQLKNQLTHVNSALANLRVEADITETSRMRALHEQVVEAQRRVSTLERELRFARPLLSDLVDAARHANCLDAALDRDIEMFFRQFGAAPSS